MAGLSKIRSASLTASFVLKNNAFEKEKEGVLQGQYLQSSDLSISECTFLLNNFITLIISRYPVALQVLCGPCI